MFYNKPKQKIFEISPHRAVAKAAMTRRRPSPLPNGGCVVIRKDRIFGKGERRSGGEDLGR